VSQEGPPNVGRGLLKRGALCGLVIILLAAGSVSAAGFLEADSILQTITKEGRAPIEIPEIDRAEAGEAQTLMILGSDQRYGDKKLGIKPRSDTIILVRLDPDKEATAVMSVPRDLKVDIPGHNRDRINAAYELGGPRLTVKTVKRLFGEPGKPFKINHIVQVDFGGFRKVINYIGGVYVDIDRDYFNDNSQGENFATIDVNPGYQKLKGQDALDYVRYRHGDNDLVRAARQQDFLRQVRNAAGARRLLDYRRRRQLAKIFARYTDTDKALRHKKDVFSLLKLVLFTGQKPVREVRFRVNTTDDPVYLTASRDKLRKTLNEFLNARASKQPRTATRASAAERRSARNRNRKHRNRASDVPGLEVARREGEDQAIVGARRAHFPFYFPTLRYRDSRYAGTEPRIYKIKDEQGKSHRAYRLVVWKAIVGEYYGVEGTTWRDPPILDDPSETRRINGRKLELHYDGRRLRLVAWRTKRAVYWVSNTLTQSLGTRQMIGIAASLRRLGQK
jgi:polyisoprenyl-teichoic acid--peptidoglycan teichoic acid transferase